MGRSTSSSSSSSLIFLLPYIFLLSVDFYGANLRANAVTPLIQRACDFSMVREFCYNVMENDPEAQLAKTKVDIENVTIRLAYSNFTNIARKAWTITSCETNPEYKQIYRKCLHQYIRLRLDFQNFTQTLESNGDLDQVALGAITHIFACTSFFQSPSVPNPFAQDNDNLGWFIELIRDIYLTL
ncbi:PREDICTED: uncharacterized protein LOC109230354 [Nicotiana attenuata]|uniref:Pectinesterase inhibitor domain-containing protein n=1 Tax=Nicotiana attenuata TaxID=49451 RepID=A0A1J6I8X0_NICAT|nr:PREDICTED: uncharacterized protein LOC109230354 [Nicotiana attenuata]OIT01422.1 hypothetical protein A4A49_28443 [Nicotiana attenuata]